MVNGSETTSSHFISKVTVFWCPTFQMENLKPSSFSVLNAPLNWAAAEAEHGEGTLRKALQRIWELLWGISEGILFILANEDKNSSVLLQQS